MDTGQAVMESLPVDLSDVVLETMERLSPLAARYGVRLEAGELPEARILGDRQHLIQMVSNLVDNGIKYAAGDNKKICIETGKAGETAWVRVSDNGPGIAKQELGNVLKPFYSTKPDHLGLGLYYALKIMKLHGGNVFIDTAGNTSGITNNTTIPATFKLYQNYPNPFNPVTKIKLDVAAHLQYSFSKSKMNVYLKIFDIQGKEIATLVNEQLKAGTYEVEFKADDLPSGVYYYKITAGNYTNTKKMILLK